MMVEILKATAAIPQSFSFDGRRIREGDEIVCQSRMVVETLMKLGCFERAEVAAVDLADARSEHIGYATADVPPTPKKRGRPRKNQYGRRDMRAAE